MTCYFRHLQQVFKKAGIEVTNENKREIDKIIHDIVRVEYKDCPATWKEAKKRIAEDEEDSSPSSGKHGANNSVRLNDKNTPSHTPIKTIKDTSASKSSLPVVKT